jgi:hypothetical protein
LEPSEERMARVWFSAIEVLDLKREGGASISGLWSDLRFSLIESDARLCHSLRLSRDASTVRFGLKGADPSGSLVASLELSSEDIVGLTADLRTMDGTRVLPSLLPVTSKELLPAENRSSGLPSVIVSVEPMTTDFLPSVVFVSDEGSLSLP